jgi:hypothetical protein
MTSQKLKHWRDVIQGYLIVIEVWGEDVKQDEVVVRTNGTVATNDGLAEGHRLSGKNKLITKTKWRKLQW